MKFSYLEMILKQLLNNDAYNQRACLSAGREVPIPCLSKWHNRLKHLSRRPKAQESPSPPSLQRTEHHQTGLSQHPKTKSRKLLTSKTVH